MQIGKSAIVRSHFGGIDLIPAVMSIGVLNVALDFWVLLLPVPKLIALKGVSKQRKIGSVVAFRTLVLSFTTNSSTASASSSSSAS